MLGSFTACTFDHVPVARNYSIWDKTSPTWLIPKHFWYSSQYTFASFYWLYGHADREIVQRQVQGAAERTPQFGRGIASGGERVQWWGARRRTAVYVPFSVYTMA